MADAVPGLLQFLRINSKSDSEIVTPQSPAVLAVIAASEGAAGLPFGPADHRRLRFRFAWNLVAREERECQHKHPRRPAGITAAARCWSLHRRTIHSSLRRLQCGLVPRLNWDRGAPR